LRKLPVSLLVLFGIVLLFRAPGADAQAVYGSVYGAVTDSSGAAVVGATVTVTDTNKGTSMSVQTNGSGEFTAQHLIPDTYDVKVDMAGYQGFESRAIRVSADTSTQVNAALTLGATNQTVVVNGGTTVLKTDRADVATVLSEKQTTNLPNLNRNLTSFELLIPGSQQLGWSHASDENPQGSQQIMINGQLPFATDYLLDGAENEDPNLGIIVINPPLDSIAETKITTQNFDAEFGKAVAGVVSVQTKSGSNEIHGSAFEYRHSDAQLARDPFTQFARNPVSNKFIPPVLYNQFGGTVGGPIKKNRVFFFADYQGVRQKTGSSFFQTVPTALVHSSCTGSPACDLSEYIQGGQGQVYDPNTGNPDGSGRQPFAGNLVPTSRISPAALNLLALIPEPNLPGINNNYVASGSGSFTTNDFDTRIDAQVSERFHAFGRYSYFGSKEVGPTALGAAGGDGFGIGGYGGQSLGRNQGAILGGDYQLKPSLLTDFRLGFFRLRVNTQKYDNTDFATKLGMPGLNVNEFSQGAPAFYVTNLSSLGSGLNVNRCNCDLIQLENQFQVVDNWTKIIGNHSVRFGADLRYLQQYRVEGAPNQAGELTFASSFTSNPSQSVPGGLGLATLLLGQTTSFQRFIQHIGNAEDREKEVFSYVQDTWRATDKFTLTYGLRWDIYFPQTVNGKAKGSNLDLNTGELLVAGYPGIGTNMNVETSFKTFSPRLGIAYQMHRNTVLRLGYGRSYDIGTFGSIFGEGPTENLPVVANQSLNPNSSVNSVFALDSGPAPYAFPAVPANGRLFLDPGISAHVRPARMVIPTVDAWNVSLQQQLGHATSLEVAYVGNKGTHNMFDGGGSYNNNQPTIAGFTPGSNTNLRRPYYAKFGWTQDLTYFNPQNSGTYNALQAKVERRYSNGLQMLANYTWSKAMEYQADYFDIDPRVNYGPAAFNRAHTFNLSGVYDLPFGHQKPFFNGISGWVNQVIGGFTLNGDMTVSSGFPFTYSYNECGNDRDTGPCRPDKFTNVSAGLGSRSFDPVDHSVLYFNPVAPLTVNGASSGAFRRPQLATFGNVGNNSAFGPGEVNVDLALNKLFTIRERYSLQLRAEAYNALNHPNYGNPNGCVDCSLDSNPGKITDIALPMRQLQFSARIQF
jgi:hypothetical protein